MKAKWPVHHHDTTPQQLQVDTEKLLAMHQCSSHKFLLVKYRPPLHVKTIHQF